MKDIGHAMVTTKQGLQMHSIHQQAISFLALRILEA